jgi:hypothetical protein
MKTPDERGVVRARRDDPRRIAGLLGENAIADHLGEPWQILILLSAGAVPCTGRIVHHRREAWAISG